MTVAVLGEALIDLIVEGDGRYRPHLGGSPYNVAVGLARQNIPVSYLSPLSDDRFGDQLSDALISEGVEIRQSRRSRRPTSLAIVSIGEAGLPTYRLYREGVADKDASFDDIERVLPEDLRVFHTGSLAITPSQLPRVRKLIDLMHARGVIVSVDINVRQRASEDTKAYLAGVRSLLEVADIVKASDEDLEALELDTEPEKRAELAFKEMRSGMLVYTEGRAGSSIITSHGRIKKRAFPVTHLADTVGAGDTFHSAFLAAILRSGELDKAMNNISKASLASALEFANAAAAINVSREGCSPPTRQEVDDLIESTSRRR